MALSVSGFPEPSRHAGSSSEVFTGDNGMQDGFGKAGLMNSPRLRGLFGASSSSSGPGSSKRPDTKNPATTSKQDAEASGGFGITVGVDESSQSSSATATTPPTTPSLSFSTSSFEPLSQAEYELELQIPSMATLPPLEAPRPSGAKRAGLPPLPRKTTQSPVRLGPNLSRLEIAGSWARSPPTLHPKPLPPSVVVQEWSSAKVTTGADVVLSTSPPQQPRPLPSVPGNTVELTKQVSNAVTGPSMHPNAISTATAPVVGPSRHVNAIAGSSKHVNAVAGPSKHANAIAGSSKHPDALLMPASSPTASTTSSPPTSKVIIAQTTTLSQPTHKNTPSLSMRYQPLVAEPTPESSPSTSSGSSSKNSSSDANANTNTTNPSNTVMISSPVRPLPRIPPTTGTAASTSTVSANAAIVNVSVTASSSSSSSSSSQLRAGPSAADPSSAQFIPSPARAKRPKTSPSPITGFTLPSPAPSSNASPSTGKNSATTTSSVSNNTSSAASVLTTSSANNITAFSRSPFDNITTSWASRASELNVKGKVLPARAHPHARRANSPPLPVGGGTRLLPPRARSHSRPRRDRSLDSFYASSTSTSKPPSRVSSPVTTVFGINQFPSTVGGVSSPTGARSPRSLASPTIGGARPITKKSTTLPANKGLHIQTSTATLAFGTGNGKTFTGTSHGGNTWIVSPSGGKRSQPPSPPTGPIKPRARPSPISSPTIHAPVPSSRVLPRILVDAAVIPSIPAISKAAATTQSTVVDVTTTTQAKANEGTTILDLHSIIETQSIDSGMHNHPIEALTDDGESVAQRPISPTLTTESPIEAFIDDQDFSTLSRSPSPIRYARPDSVGIFTDSEDEMTYAAYASSSSSASSRDSSPNPVRRRRNQQLRSYRNSYRPRSGRSSPPYIPYERPRSPSPIQEIAVEEAQQNNSNRNSQKSISKKKKAKSSYFGGGGGGGGLSTLSTPGTRASSPERKSRSRQPRRLAEAVSSALEEVRNRGRVASTSPKRKIKAGASFGGSSGNGGLTSGNIQMEINAAGGQNVVDMDVLDITLPSLSRRQTDGTIDTRSSISDNQTGNSSARSSAKVGWAKVVGRKRSEIGDMSSSASGSAAQLNADQNDLTETWPSKKTSHRRVDSFGGGGPNNNSQEQDLDDDQYRSRGITLSKIETTITSTVTVTRPPSSSVSTPFSGFSITGKSKKKRAMSVTTPSTGNTTDGFLERPALIIHKTYEGHDGHDIKDMGGWVDLTNGDDEGDRGDLTGDRRALIEEGGELVVVTTKRIMRGVDGDGDIWEHEQETGVADIIPHLRNLKASRS